MSYFDKKEYPSRKFLTQSNPFKDSNKTKKTKKRIFDSNKKSRVNTNKNYDVNLIILTFFRILISKIAKDLMRINGWSDWLLIGIDEKDSLLETP